MTHDSEPRRPYWIKGPVTRRHRYFYASSNLPGIALLALIGALGAFAAFVAMKHLAAGAETARRDWALLAAGLFFGVVGCWQAIRLWIGRRP